MVGGSPYANMPLRGARQKHHLHTATRSERAPQTAHGSWGTAGPELPGQVMFA